MTKIIATASLFLGLFGVDWDAVDEKIDKEFPAVTFISTDQLQQRLLRSAATSERVAGEGNGVNMPVLIDVREPDEYQVSHLPAALNLMAETDIARLYPDRNTEIVVYCSVGYRSAAVAAKLDALGYTNVRNLRHSLFEWANKTYPMVNAEGATDKAHPFNRIWGSLLQPEIRQYQP